jgi:excinuclease ABC subunit A
MPDIRIINARSHNLQGVSCRIPLGALTVVTGVSGSGKSTLAFDTLYAEGQRRYVTSLSTYARQFLERLPRPDVDSISNLPPAIAIERRKRVTSARSTVGTATEILDYLRILYAKIGETRCPDCDRRVEPGTVEAVGGRILERWQGQRIALGAPLSQRRGESAAAMRERLAAEGFTRLLDAEAGLVDVSEISARQFASLRSRALLLVDRLALRPGDGRARLNEAIATAFARGEGRCVAVPETGERVTFREGIACDSCGRGFPVLRPALFSFNSPLGACPECQGFGRVPRLDPERVIPDPDKSIEEGAILPFTTPRGRRAQRKLLLACRERGVPTNRPVSSLSAAQRDWILRGDMQAPAGARSEARPSGVRTDMQAPAGARNEAKPSEVRTGVTAWRGVQGYFDRLERKRYRVQNRVLIARYRRFDSCDACGGARLQPEALCVRVGGRHLGELGRLTLGELLEWLDALALAPHEAERSGRLREDLRSRIATAIAVGLDYITLDRPMRTLAGGEAQRMQLAAALGGTLTASLYVLDEPSIGLHARDAERLVSTLQRIRDQGNTVVVVEHAPEIVEAADHVIDLGPGAGHGGGRLVVEGPVETLRAHPTSLTGRVLRGAVGVGSRRRRCERGRLRVVGARANNLRDLSVEFPLGQLVVATGVSGAGKSTLVRSVLVGNLKREPDRGACTRIEGAEALSDVVVMDGSPPVRSPRSNPATVSKAFDPIRQRFAATRQARALGRAAGWFSFNVAGGRCDACEGAGEVVVDMQFLDDVRMPCDDCGGRRYRPEVLGIRVKGLSIVDVLALPVEDALALFSDDRRIARRLEPLVRVGLGYLALGQPLSTLSGGEAQRLRIARALTEGSAGCLFVLDEPTTGLHPADIEVLLHCLDRILEAGGSVIVVEHNLDVIRRADFVIDLGPEGGPGGGWLVAAGPPEVIAASPGSHTGAALRAAGVRPG